MPYNRKAFGVVIGRLRAQKGLTQERMSGLAGIARSHLVELENGKKTVKLSTLWDIAYALDLKPSELLRLVEKETEEGGQGSLPEMVTEFSEELWGSLVDHVTVHSKDNIVFTLTSGMEIKA